MLRFYGAKYKYCSQDCSFPYISCWGSMLYMAKKRVTYTLFPYISCWGSIISSLHPFIVDTISIHLMLRFYVMALKVFLCHPLFPYISCWGSISLHQKICSPECISIHLMLRFYSDYISNATIYKRISIHLMLRFYLYLVPAFWFRYYFHTSHVEVLL